MKLQKFKNKIDKIQYIYFKSEFYKENDFELFMFKPKNKNYFINRNIRSNIDLIDDGVENGFEKGCFQRNNRFCMDIHYIVKYLLHDCLYYGNMTLEFKKNKLFITEL